jgi:hypothetical protein
VSVCGNCKAEVDSAAAQGCWYCDAVLCYPCWDDVGHCGHPEAEALNQAARAHKPGDPLLPRPWVRAEVDEWAGSFDGGKP